MVGDAYGIRFPDMNRSHGKFLGSAVAGRCAASGWLPGILFEVRLPHGFLGFDGIEFGNGPHQTIETTNNPSIQMSDVCLCLGNRLPQNPMVDHHFHLVHLY